MGSCWTIVANELKLGTNNYFNKLNLYAQCRLNRGAIGVYSPPGGKYVKGAKAVNILIFILFFIF